MDDAPRVVRKDVSHSPFNGTPSLQVCYSLPSPIPKVFIQSPTQAEQRAIRVGKRKASQWLRTQVHEANLERALAETDLEKRLHDQTKAQLHLQVQRMRRRALLAERGGASTATGA